MTDGDDRSLRWEDAMPETYTIQLCAAPDGVCAVALDAATMAAMAEEEIGGSTATPAEATRWNVASTVTGAKDPGCLSCGSNSPSLLQLVTVGPTLLDGRGSSALWRVRHTIAWKDPIRFHQSHSIGRVRHTLAWLWSPAHQLFLSPRPNPITSCDT